MNKASFLTLVRQASRISDQDVEELEKLVVNFPYCQTAHLLIAKAAYDKGSMLSNQKLKKAAIYAANRQLLKKLIFTSDASVSLQPLETETPETVAELPPKPTAPETEITAALETEMPETTNEIIPEQVIPEQADPENEKEKEKEEAEGEKLLAETNAILADLAKEKPELTVAEAFYEDASIAEEILEEGRLPELEADFVPDLNEPETFVFSSLVTTAPEIEVSETESSETDKLPEFSDTSKTVSETEEKPEPQENSVTASSEIPAIAEIQETGSPATINPEPEKTVAETEEKVAAAKETAIEEAGSEVTEPETEISEPAVEPEAQEMAVAIDPENETATTRKETPETVAESQEKVEEMVAEAAHSLEDVPGVHELFLENAPETLSTDPAENQPETPEETEKTGNLHDDLLHETLASFDQYLFKPEKELQPEPEETPEPGDELKIVYPQDEIKHIYEQDKLGYWMSSSRLGESLQLKDELTSTQPFDFHPELIWEYSKTNELRKEIKPAPSKLTKQLEIIDEFLKLTPRLKVSQNKVKTEAQEDLSSKSSKINKSLASENFANILVQQGKIKKAIKIYEHLILKIPEKKAYFVAQIEKLQNQN